MKITAPDIPAKLEKAQCVELVTKPIKTRDELLFQGEQLEETGREGISLTGCRFEQCNLVRCHFPNYEIRGAQVSALQALELSRLLGIEIIE